MFLIGVDVLVLRVNTKKKINKQFGFGIYLLFLYILTVEINMYFPSQLSIPQKKISLSLKSL